jgi:hypothetical protein
VAHCAAEAYRCAVRAVWYVEYIISCNQFTTRQALRFSSVATAVRAVSLLVPLLLLLLLLLLSPCRRLLGALLAAHCCRRCCCCAQCLDIHKRRR